MTDVVESPLRLFVHWFDSLHVDDKADMACYTWPLLGELLRESRALRDVRKAVGQALDEYVDALRGGNDARDYDCLAALVGSIDFYLATRSTAEDWVRRRDSRVRVEREAHVRQGGGEAALAARLHQVDVDFDERARRHIAYASKWADLRALELSPKYLGYWLTQHADFPA